MLFLACLLAASARAAQFAQSPAQMTASAREYFASPSAEPAGLAATLRSLEGVDLDDPASSLALENLTDETRKAADDLLADSGTLLTSDEKLARSMELSHVLQRTPLSRLLTERQRLELSRYERELVTMTERETAARVEKRLAALAEALDGLSRPAAAPVPASAAVPPAAARTAQVKTTARRAERELRRFQRQTRRSAPRPSIDKPVTVPDWLRGPREKTGLEAEIDAERQAVLAAARRLEEAPAESRDDAARALAATIAGAKFAGPQERGLAALRAAGFDRLADETAGASPFPHLRRKVVK